MLTDEVRAEMLEVLWRAHLNYSSSQGTTLPQYWWSCWLHRKADLIEAAFRQKRDVRKEMLVDLAALPENEYTDSFGWWETLAPLVTYEEVVERLIPQAPEIVQKGVSASIADSVWELLARGYTRKDVLDTGVSVSTYSKIIASWRCDEVRGRLAQ
jgi:hypothetical protein